MLHTHTVSNLMSFEHTLAKKQLEQEDQQSGHENSQNYATNSQEQFL